MASLAGRLSEDLELRGDGLSALRALGDLCDALVAVAVAARHTHVVLLPLQADRAL